MSLPAFDRPPVTEVAIGVQFGTIQELRQPHFGLFWSRIRADYPQVQDQPPLPHQQLVGAQPKPFQIEEVVARVEHHIRFSRLQREIESQNTKLLDANLKLKEINDIKADPAAAAKE